MTQLLRSDFSSASDSTIRSKWLNFFYRSTDRKIESFYPKKLSQILILPVTQLLGAKWLNFFLGAQSEKIESFWPKKLGRISIPPVTQPFKSKWLNFFSRCTERKKLSHFDLKSWVEFWFRKWQLLRSNISDYFFSRCTERKNWDILT